MSEISRVQLFGKLNSLGYKAIESATVFCKMRGNPYVELVHWVHQVLQLPDQAVVLDVRDLRVIEHVVAIIVMPNLITKRLDASFDIPFIAH